VSRARFVYSMGPGFRLTGSWVHVGPVPNPVTDATREFNAPRARYGDAVPFIFGTVQTRSPICIWSGQVSKGNPFNWIDPEDKEHYWSSLDLLLCERVLTDGVQVGTITLRKIWIGQRLLWDGSNFETPVTTSNNLLRHDPNGNDDSLIPGGGYIDSGGQDRIGIGWWWGGLVGEQRKVSYPASNPSFIPDQWRGDVLGGLRKIANSGIWAQYLGLEKIHFYAGSGSETQDAIGEEVYTNGTWNTELQYIYPSFHKFARLVFHQFIWGPQATLDDISAEVTVTCPAVAIGDTTGLMPNGLDVNPVSVLYTLLTHPDFCGGPKLPGVDVDSFAEARVTINSERLGMSYRLLAPTKAADLVEYILDHVDGELVHDPVSGLIQLRLNRLVQTAPPRFNASHVISVGELTKTTWLATYSQARVKFEFRGSAGNEASGESIAVAKDPGLAASSGATETFETEMPTVYDPEVASKIAARMLSDANVPLVKLQLKMNRREAASGGISALDLRPGDMFVLDYAPLGLTNLRLRVVKAELGSLEDNSISLTATQDIYQAQAIIAPPGQPDGYTIIEPPDEIEIETYRAWTAPYYIARNGLGPDARFALTTAPLYQVDEDTDGKQFAVNYDRFMMLAKAPYVGASRFQWSVVEGGTTVHSATVPYTECGTLGVSVSAPLINADGTLSSMQIDGLTNDGVAMLTSSPDKILLVNDEMFLVSGSNATVSEDGASVTIAPLLRQILDSTEVSAAHDIGDTVWILNSSDAAWCSARLAPPLRSSVEEYWDFDDEDPTDGYFNDFQTLVGEHTHRIRNIDPSKVNIETSDTAQLENRANCALPPRQADVATATASASSAATSFTFDFAQLTSVPRLYQQREIGHLSGVSNSFSLLLPREQQSSDLASAESIPGILTSTQEDDWHHVAKLEVWYEYNTGPLAGTLRKAAVSDAGDGSVSFAATAEGTTRLVDCYLRACFAPYILGDAGYVPIRRSVARSFRITLNRT
jgi:hypothetical protein